MFKVFFVGMICLLNQAGGRLALLPNALNEPGMPHVARIAIDLPANIVTKSANWGADAHADGDFLLKQPCTIEIEGAAVADPAHPFKTSGKPPIALPPGFKIDPQKANAIAQVPIKAGTLTEMLWPRSSPVNQHASVISELDVPHGPGNIHIKVTLKNGTVRTIEVKPNTEIAIVNDISSTVKAHLISIGQLDHYHIYQRLGTPASPKLGITPLIPPNTYPVLNSKHRVFEVDKKQGIVGGLDCPNNGCC